MHKVEATIPFLCVKPLPCQGSELVLPPSAAAAAAHLCAVLRRQRRQVAGAAMPTRIISIWRVASARRQETEGTQKQHECGK